VTLGRFKHTRKGLNFNGTHQLLVYADEINLLDENLHTFIHTYTSYIHTYIQIHIHTYTSRMRKYIHALYTYINTGFSCRKLYKELGTKMHSYGNVMAGRGLD
jgi:hypothetical protein